MSTCMPSPPRFQRTYEELKPVFGNQERRYFLTDILRDANHREVLDLLYRQASLIILLVRDRLEQEKPIEITFEEVDDDE